MWKPETSSWESPGVDGRIPQIYLTGRGQESMDSINPEQDRGKWRAVV
jgi:hypothetical protein